MKRIYVILSTLDDEVVAVESYFMCMITLPSYIVTYGILSCDHPHQVSMLLSCRLLCCKEVHTSISLALQVGVTVGTCTDSIVGWTVSAQMISIGT